MLKRVTIGFIGPIGSGKGIAAKYLVERHSFYRIIMGNLVRAIARRKSIKITRKNLQNLAKNYRKRYGENYFISITIEKAKKSKKDVVIDGIRTFADAQMAKKGLNAKIVLIDAKPEIRFKRLQKRRRKGFSETFAQFKLEEKNEPGFVELKKTLREVNYKIENNATEKDLYKKLDNLVKRLKG